MTSRIFSVGFLVIGAISLAGPVGCAQTASIADGIPADTPLSPPNIPEPTFGSQTYSVKDFGAVGDFKTNDTPAINKAIEQCSNSGGGSVTFPPGKYLVASVHLKSNVCLQ